MNVRVPSSELRREDYVERAVRGGYPEAVRRADPGRRSRFFESYITDLVNRDVRQLTEIERPAWPIPTLWTLTPDVSEK